MKNILVLGGAGYVGSRLIPALHEKRYEVHSVDILQSQMIAGPYYHLKDIRALKAADLKNIDAVIHLAGVSNDPSFDLDPALGKSINYDCFRPIVRAAKEAGVRRFIFASSSSVYGVKDTKDVVESLPLQPLTDYSRFKAECEQILLEERAPGFETVSIRPATVCGYAPSMRLDLLVHILTHHAWRHGKINVHGGHQYRPNIHIDDMVDAYIAALEAPAELVDGQVFNAGYRNLTILETAELVKSIVGEHVTIEVTESTDPRSYHVNSDKIRRVLGFAPKRTVEDAIKEVVAAFEAGKIPDPAADKYYRVKQMKNMELAA